MASLRDLKFLSGEKTVGTASAATFDEGAGRVIAESVQWPNALDYLQKGVKIFARYSSTNREFREGMKFVSISGDYKEHRGRAEFSRGF